MAGLDRNEEPLRARSAKQVQNDHYLHWAALMTAGGYAWQVHGFAIGLIVFVTLIGLIALTNTMLLSRGRLDLIRKNRWLWVVAAFLLVGLSGASTGTIPR